MSIMSDHHMQQLIRQGVAIECGIFFKGKLYFAKNIIATMKQEMLLLKSKQHLLEV